MLRQGLRPPCCAITCFRAHESIYLAPDVSQFLQLAPPMDILALDSLYNQYGFDMIPLRSDAVRAYALRSGYFLNADIVATEPGADTERVKRELEAAGYACSIRLFSNNKEAEDQLFEGFFAAESSRYRLQLEYDRFSAKVSRLLGAPYQYVSGPYTCDSVDGEPEIDVVDHLLNLLASEGPTLVILEAAAGFGKTCTGYEALERLLRRNRGQVPIMTELSLNRQAKIFRYVLLDEIDRNFPSLRSELVREQIQRGRMPLIVDGFDELLSRGSVADDQFEEAESMLETISALLQGEAKILLTTRRTAIFSDVEFDRWLESRPEEFTVHRVRLTRPTLEDWLGPDRARLLADRAVPIRELSNPVLLAYLRNLEEDEYKELCENPHRIVRNYFEALLKREVERQDLIMSVADQMAVFRSLAGDMLKETFTTEPREYIQLRISVSNVELLERTKLAYRQGQRPTVEELATKLSSHALLDKRGSDDQQVGFVNDFVLGTLLGDAIKSNEVRPMETGDLELFVDFAVTAYAAQAEEDRRVLWDRLSDVTELFDVNRQFQVDVALMGTTRRDFKDAAFVGLTIEDAEIGSEKRFTDCIFIDCSFRRVRVKGEMLTAVTFLNCSFYELRVDATASAESPIRLIACRGDEESLSRLDELSTYVPVVEESESEQEAYERAILENFWPKGRASPSRSKLLRTLYRGHSKHEYEHIGLAIERLRKQGLISIRSDQADLNPDKMDLIKNYLGRNGISN